MDDRGEPWIEQFFMRKDRAFWILQTCGWLGYGLLRFLNGLVNKMGLEYLAPTLISTATGFSLSLIMAAVFRHIVRYSAPVVWSVSALVVFLCAAPFSIIEVWGFSIFFAPTWEPHGLQFLGAILIDVTVLTAWTALYYSINYYLMLRHQMERMLALSAQAHAAQLKMLRYQLNPHFLFNTLNSISTLVMLKETDRANAMLSRLSAFLRYSLVGEPSHMVTLEQEVRALQLYLDIERMRFEERLRVSFEISDAAQEALLPSLLLQPLVENAIKYAVAPSENGADIALKADVERGRLCITVADTGQGFSAGTKHSGSSGVGLVNIRDRLNQAYGDDHRFELGANEPHGVVVRIEIPYQRAGRATLDMEAAE
ncbi:MAG TPA: histidine kinase [Pedomonas sp.]|nr:histidine kinase [Pedomonas sp.]